MSDAPPKLGDPSEVDTFTKALTHRAGYGSDMERLERVRSYARRGHTLQAGEGLLLEEALVALEQELTAVSHHGERIRMGDEQKTEDTAAVVRGRASLELVSDKGRRVTVDVSLIGMLAESDDLTNPPALVLTTGAAFVAPGETYDSLHARWHEAQRMVCSRSPVRVVDDNGLRLLPNGKVDRTVADTKSSSILSIVQ